MEENLNQNQEVQNEATQPTPEMPAQEQAPQQPEGQPYQQHQQQPYPPQYQQPYQQQYQQHYQQPYQQPYQQVPCQRPERLRRNHIGGTGFVLSVIGIVLFWFPYVRFILGVLGLTLSLVGIFRKNCRKAFPIAGLILSSLVLFIIAIIWYSFGYGLSDIFNEDFIDFLNFLDK